MWLLLSWHNKYVAQTGAKLQTRYFISWHHFTIKSVLLFSMLFESGRYMQYFSFLHNLRFPEASYKHVLFFQIDFLFLPIFFFSFIILDVFRIVLCYLYIVHSRKNFYGYCITSSTVVLSTLYIPSPVNCHILFLSWSYLPTPPLGQDMTQGQILSGV